MIKFASAVDLDFLGNKIPIDEVKEQISNRVKQQFPEYKALTWDVRQPEYSFGNFVVLRFDTGEL